MGPIQTLGLLKVRTLGFVKFKTLDPVIVYISLLMFDFRDRALDEFGFYIKVNLKVD